MLRAATRLTGAGQALAGALMADVPDVVAERTRAVLDGWGLTADVRGVLRANTMPEDELVPVVASLAGAVPRTRYCGTLSTSSYHDGASCDGPVIYVDDEWICGQCGVGISLSETCTVGRRPRSDVGQSPSTPARTSHHRPSSRASTRPPANGGVYCCSDGLVYATQNFA